MSSTVAVEAEESTALAEGCVCDRCLPSCSSRPFYPCCGACMIGTMYDDGNIRPTEFWADLMERHPEQI